MLKRSLLKKNKKIKHIQAEASVLPFNDNSIDLIFSNLCMPWLNDLPFFFREIRRVTKKDGLFIFSTLGPDSLLALKKAWAEIDNFSHINNYIDMHIIGDQLMNVGLLDPVLDSERMIIRYDNISSIERDLTCTGARNALTARECSLTGIARSSRNLAKRDYFVHWYFNGSLMGDNGDIITPNNRRFDGFTAQWTENPCKLDSNCVTEINAHLFLPKPFSRQYFGNYTVEFGTLRNQIPTGKRKTCSFLVCVKSKLGRYMF